MSIDLSKLKVGDTIRAEFVVGSISPNTGRIFAPGPSSFPTVVRPSDVVAIIPKPIEVKVGTKFKTSPNGAICTVLRIHGQIAAFCFLHGGVLVATTYSISAIKGHIEAFPVDDQETA